MRFCIHKHKGGRAGGSHRAPTRPRTVSLIFKKSFLNFFDPIFWVPEDLTPPPLRVGGSRCRGPQKEARWVYVSVFVSIYENWWVGVDTWASESECQCRCRVGGERVPSFGWPRAFALVTERRYRRPIPLILSPTFAHPTVCCAPPLQVHK